MTGEPGIKEQEKAQEKPKDLVSFVKKYWIYILPALFILALPVNEEVPRPPSPREGTGMVQRKVAPGPGPGSRNSR